MEYKFEKEQKAIEGIIRKVKVISVLLTGVDLVPIRPTPEFTKRLINNLLEWSKTKNFLSEDKKYYICENLYIENRKVVAYIDRGYFYDEIKESVAEEEFYILLNNILPELFPEYEDEFYHCFDALTSSEYNEGIKLFFNTINKLIKEGELEIEIEEIKKAKEEINKATAYSYSDFIEEFSQIVFDLFEKYIDINKDGVYENIYSEVLNSYSDYIKEYISKISKNIKHEIDYTYDWKIKIMLEPLDEFCKPNFTSAFYQIENALDNCISSLREKLERATSAEELIKNLIYGSSPEDTLTIDLAKRFSSGELFDERNILPFMLTLTISLKVDDVYPTELSLKICDLLKEIRGE